MKLIVGLGNPGKEYENTRHNIGFRALDNYAFKHNLVFQKEKFQGLYTDFQYKGEKIILLKPQSYINLSGEVVSKYIDYFKIDINDILIIHDDLDLNVGIFKLKPMGSSGGHNGLKNIELHLATRNYKRLKIGISNNKLIDTKDYVLGKLTKEETDKLNIVIDLSTSIIDDFLNLNFDLLMNKYNKK